MTKRSATKRMRRALRVTACLMLTVSTSRSATRLAVTADRVNLRAAPQSEAEVVGQVSRTDTLILQGSLTDPWVQVQPPDTIDLWVYAPLVKDNTIDVSAAQVRAGAGLNFNVVGRLERGDTIVRRGQISDWIKIAPFPGSSVWITNTYVALIHPETPPRCLRNPRRSARFRRPPHPRRARSRRPHPRRAPLRCHGHRLSRPRLRPHPPPPGAPCWDQPTISRSARHAFPHTGCVRRSVRPPPVRIQARSPSFHTATTQPGFVW